MDLDGVVVAGFHEFWASCGSDEGTDCNTHENGVKNLTEASPPEFCNQLQFSSKSTVIYCGFAPINPCAKISLHCMLTGQVS